MKRYLILIRPSKTKNDENFPVASWIISTQFRPHIHVFYNCVRAADDVADNPNLKPEEKLLLLKQMDLELQGKSQKTDFVKPAIKLLASSKQTGVTIEHARHLLQAFLMDVEKKRYQKVYIFLGFLIHLNNVVDVPKKVTCALLFTFVFLFSSSKVE